MSIQIVIKSSMRSRGEVKSRIDWLTEKVATGEINVSTSHTEDDAGNIVYLDTTVTIWSDNCEKVAVEYYLRF